MEPRQHNNAYKGLLGAAVGLIWERLGARLGSDGLYEGNKKTGL